MESWDPDLPIEEASRNDKQLNQTVFMVLPELLAFPKRR
jgi:hypothetical protein